MKKKMLALVMAAMMTSLVACGAGEADDGKYDIGVVQLVQHVALDAATQGFVDTVNAALGEENINWDIQNAAGDSNTGIIDGICHGKVPVFAGEEGICSGCGVATLSISYYDLGVATGNMAVKILKGEAKVAEMPIEYAGNVTYKYNEANCTALGLTAPDGYVAIG